MNFNFIVNIPIPYYLNENNSLELFDIDNDYNIINDLFIDDISNIDKHLYIVNKLIQLNWELRKIYHSILSYYIINFENDENFINYIKESLKISIYIHYKNEYLLNNHFILNNQFIFDYDIDNEEYYDFDENNQNLLENIEDLNVIKYENLDEHTKNKYIECNICYEQFNNDTNVVLLNCDGKHIYCNDCIVVWLKDYNNTCPICKN